MRYLIVGDLHGRKPRILERDFDAIIAPGDVCGDAHYRGATTKWIKSGMKVGWGEFMLDQFGEDRMEEIDAQNLASGRRVMEYLNGFGVPVYFVPGNWDQSDRNTRIVPRDAHSSWRAIIDKYSSRRSNPALVKGLRNVIDCQWKIINNGHANILGYGLSSAPEDPVRYKSRVSAKQYRDLQRRYRTFCGELGKLYRKRDRTLPTLFITHNVPHNTPVDKVVKPGTAIHGRHFGSTVARWFCDKYQPKVCIGGHMHEHHRDCKIGRTRVINAGFGARVNTLLELKNGRITTLKYYDA